MVEFFESIAYAYGTGFVYLFSIPAAIICGIVLFEICDSEVREWRERRERRRDGVAPEDELAHEAPLFHAGRPETRLRKWHYRPLDPALTQPFAKQPNRPVSDAYRWG